MCWDPLNWGPKILSMLLTWGRAGGDWELCANDHRSNHLINNSLQEPITKAEEGLPTFDFWLPTSVFRLPTYDFRLLTSDFRLQTSDLTKCEHRISDFWPFRLKAEWLDLRTSHFPLPTSHFRLPTSDFQLTICHFWFPTSDFWLDSSVWLDRRSIHQAGINAQSQSSVEDGRTAHAGHKREQLNLLLKKQLSTKPTRQPMRFAWRTGTMVLPDHKVAITKQSKH